MARNREPVAFVLSGGAGLGAIQAGMLRALYEREITPDLIVGTSAGALNGAFIASRPQTIETADALRDVWTGLRRDHAFPLNPLTGLLGFLGIRDHLVPGSGLERLIDRHTQHERLQDLPIPLHVVAVDVITGEELRLSSGSLGDAIRASAAIPGVMAPVEWDDRVLMDGGVANNTPLSHAIDLGARRIDIERHRGSAKLIVLPPPCPLGIQPIDFAHAEELIARALEDSRRFLEEGGESRPPIRMRMHRHDESEPARLSPRTAPRAASAS